MSKPTFLKKISLKLKILGLTLGITVLLGLSASFLVRHLIATSKNVILESYSTYSDSLQSSIAAQFYERYGDVQAFAINPALKSNDQVTVINYLNIYAAMYGIYDLILIVDANGKLLAVNDKDPNGKPISVASLYKRNFSDQPWFKATLAGHFTEDKTRGFEGTYVEDPQVDPSVSEAYGEKRFGNGFSTQMKDAKGNVIGVISNRAGSRWFENEFQRLHRSMTRGGLLEGELTMLDKEGNILVDYDPASQNGNTDIRHDYDVIGKLNLVTKGLHSAIEAVAGRSGKEVAIHARKNIEMATGYSPIIDRKFVPTLGWSVIVRSSAESSFAAIHKSEKVFFALFSIIAIVTILVSIAFSGSLSRNLQGLAERLGFGASEVLASSEQVASASRSLSSSATEQAAALQETVASIDQVSAMVQKNADNAEKSKRASENSQAATVRGKQAIDSMIVSIEEINSSNSSVMSQIESSNREIAAIVKVINDIGSKTKVINDIVFQTKLLSFNASVEAARAGEHGKGFAVVAEEVGNLAQMSGNAAKEISSMLDESIQKVESIVSDTKVKVEGLMLSSGSKVNAGIENARRCGQLLEEIVDNVESVNTMIQEIATASREQALGVSEITKAMNQMDRVTQENAESSNQCAGSSDDLRNQVDTLKQIVESLSQTVHGAKISGDLSVAIQGDTPDFQRSNKETFLKSA